MAAMAASRRASGRTVQDKSYKPLSPAVVSFDVKHSPPTRTIHRRFVPSFDFYVENEAKVADQALFVGLTPEQKKTAKDELGSLVA